MGVKPDQAMWAQLFRWTGDAPRALQARIREAVVSAILDGRLAPGSPMPSSRELAQSLGVARNTVVLAYQQLLDHGFLLSRERSGYFVSPTVTCDHPPAPDAAPGRGSEPDWGPRFALRASGLRNIAKPADWQAYEFPFLYGQFDPTLFPIADWRECSRRALGTLEMRGWAPDLIDGDDEMLIEQLRSRVLPRRGVWATASEIMVTIGAQQALFLLTQLLMTDRTRVGIEDPGYPDARNIVSLSSAEIRRLPIDADGLVVDERLAGCDYVYVTPSHQCPTSVTMPLARREELLTVAAERDIVLIEDDYESEINFADTPTPSLKSLDRDHRVIYVGSLSKTLAPGLRLGYIVGPAELIREARALRRLMLRHPPVNNQRTAALFLSLGHHEALARRLIHALRERAQAARRGLDRHLPHAAYSGGAGGSSYWVRGPEWLDTNLLAERARERGVLIEPGDVFFAAPSPPLNHMRIGLSSIPVDRIDRGLETLGSVIAEMRPASAEPAWH